eukprot:SM000047S16855  [mRNA]  locus=s47:363872:364977:- [translate_table: standard]
MGGGPVAPGVGGGGERPWWAVDTAAFRDHFRILYAVGGARQGRDAPLPPWSDADVDEFARQDPVHGPQLKLVRQAGAAAAGGALAGGLAAAIFAYQKSRSALTAAAVLPLGAVTAYVVTESAATLALGLYKTDALAVNLKFLDWWHRRHGGGGGNLE